MSGRLSIMTDEFKRQRAIRARRNNKHLAEIMTADLMLEIERLKAENAELKAKLAKAAKPKPTKKAKV